MKKIRILTPPVSNNYRSMLQNNVYKNCKRVITQQNKSMFVKFEKPILDILMSNIVSKLNSSNLNGMDRIASTKNITDKQIGITQNLATFFSVNILCPLLPLHSQSISKRNRVLTLLVFP